LDFYFNIQESIMITRSLGCETIPVTRCGPLQSALNSFVRQRKEQALHSAPSIFDRITFGKEKYVAYIRAALLDQAQKDNLVYHGLVGHFLLQGGLTHP
jgi:hypothetical protein